MQIDNKLELIIVPILCSQISSNSIIWSDEISAYANLKDLFFVMARVATITSSLIMIP